MSEPVQFQPFTGWVDVPDSDNLPPDVKIISAQDLLRYEKLGMDVAAWTQQFDPGSGGGIGGSVIDGGGP